MRLDACCTLLSGGTPSKANAEFWSGQIPWVSPKDMKTLTLTDAQDHISESGLRAGSALAPAGAVFIVVRGMILSRDVPVALAEVPMAFNQDVKAIIPGDELEPEYLLYALLSSKVRLAQAIGRSAHGTRTLLSDDLESLEIPVPGRDEQRAIVSAIRAVRRGRSSADRGVKVLRELKQAAMAQLFTRGLHGEAQRDSEIGSVPNTWDVVPLGSVGRIGNGSTPKRTEADYWQDGTHPWLTSGKIHERIITNADEFVTDRAITECHLPIVPAGSLLVAITGQGKTLGNVALTTFDTSVSQHLAYCTIERDDVDAQFLRLYLASRYDYLRGLGQAGGSTKGALTCGGLKMVPVPKPPLDEQREIARALLLIERKIEHHERRRALLAELFETLLDDLMTGRRRVADLTPDTAIAAA